MYEKSSFSKYLMRMGVSAIGWESRTQRTGTMVAVLKQMGTFFRDSDVLKMHIK